jgi:CheY-like chemotaxis protein
LEHANHTVLLVEDDTDDVHLIKEAIADKTGYTLIHRKNGLEALRFLEEQKIKSLSLPCLIIMDVNMPVLNGKELLTILKHDQSFNSIPIIVFTTSSNNRDKEYCSRFNVPLITKPDDTKTFNRTVNKFLDHCAAR